VSVYPINRYSEQLITVHPGAQFKELRFGLRFDKFANDNYFFNTTKGYFGAWGRQNSIVQEIGQAAIFRNRSAVLNDSPNQRNLVFTGTPGEASRLYVIRQRRSERMFPVAPTVANWETEIQELAARLHAPAQTRIGTAEHR
jgi:hypothetical protein